MVNIMKREAIISLVIGLVTSLAATAQDSTNRRVLTFEEAVRLALNNALLLNTQRNNLELNQFQKVASIAAVAPSINAFASANRQKGNTFIQKTDTLIANGIVDVVSSGIQANMNVFSGFSRINSIRQYVSFVDAQSYNVKRVSQDVMNTVATQYLNVMQDVELLRIARENLTALQKQLRQVQGQVDLGAKAPVDGYNQSALVKAAELTWVQAQVNLDNDKALLAQTLWVDAFDDFVTEIPNWDVNAIGGEVLNPEQMAEQAKQNRGDYLRALNNEKGYRFAVMSARGLLSPYVTASYSVGSAYNYTHGDNNESFHLQFHNNKQQVYGFTLNVPLFNGFQARTFLVTQKVAYENAVVTRKNVEFQIKNDVVRAVHNFDGAKKSFAITAEKLDYAQKALELETERFNLGVTSFVEYTNANRVFVQAQTDKAQAEYKLVFQKIMLSYATGTLRGEDVTSQDNN
jgi:outer membrane protein